MLVASFLLSLILIGGLIGQVMLILEERTRASETRTAVANLERALGRQTAEQTKIDVVLRQVQNSEVLDRNVFLNTLISRKDVSWTQ